MTKSDEIRGNNQPAEVQQLSIWQLNVQSAPKILVHFETLSVVILD